MLQASGGICDRVICSSDLTGCIPYTLANLNKRVRVVLPVNVSLRRGCVKGLIVSVEALPEIAMPPQSHVDMAPLAI